MKTIRQIAEEEGAVKSFVSQGYYLLDNATLERFAARIRAEQKEKDAQICDDASWIDSNAHLYADAIRNSKDSPESDIDQLTYLTQEALHSL